MFSTDAICFSRISDVKMIESEDVKPIDTEAQKSLEKDVIKTNL